MSADRDGLGLAGIVVGGASVALYFAGFGTAELFGIGAVAMAVGGVILGWESP